MAKDVIDLPLIGRTAAVRAESIDEEARTAEIVWTTGATVRRWSWADGEIDEELVVDAASVRLDRLNSGAPFLNSHDAWSLQSVIGVVVDGSARVEGGTGTATIRFSARDEVEPIWRDIMGGIIRNVSVGYRVHTYEIEKRDGQRTLYRATDWEPLEISAVAIGADAGAHFRSGSPAAGLRTPCAITRRDAAATAVEPKESDMTDKTKGAAAPEGDAVRKEDSGAPVVAVDTAAISRAAEDAERQRGADITDLCVRHGLSDLAGPMIRDKVTVEAARAQVLDKLEERDRPAAAKAEPVLSGRMDEHSTKLRGIEHALVAQLTDGAVPDHARAFMGMSLVEIAADLIGERKVPGSFGQREEVMRRAFHSGSDMPLLLENSLNKALAKRYKDATPTYRRIASQRTYADFRDHSSINLGDFPQLQPVSPEAGEIKAGTFSESREKTAVKAFGVQVNLSRQLLVNDTLDGIAKILADRGRAVARFEDATFYAMMLSGAGANGPTLLETTRQVFNTTDGTLAAAPAAINVTSVSIGRAALRKRKSLDGADLDVSAAILLVGPDKETEAQQLVAPVQAQQVGNINPFSGTLEVLTTAKIVGNAWYMFASPEDAPCFEWGLLEGYEAPRFRIEEPFGRQGMSASLEHDFGCGASGWRGGYKNAGA